MADETTIAEFKAQLEFVKVRRYYASNHEFYNLAVRLFNALAELTKKA